MQRLAPSNFMLIGQTLVSIPALAGIALMALSLWGVEARLGGATMPGFVPLLGGLGLDRALLSLGAALFGLKFLFVLARFAFTGAFIDPENDSLIFKTFNGSFQTNTIMLSQIYDCDVRANVLQALTGSGNLIITTIDSQTHTVPWAIKAEQARQHIIRHSGGRNMTAVGML